MKNRKGSRSSNGLPLIAVVFSLVACLHAASGRFGQALAFAPGLALASVLLIVAMMRNKALYLALVSFPAFALSLILTLQSPEHVPIVQLPQWVLESLRLRTAPSVIFVIVYMPMVFLSIMVDPYDLVRRWSGILPSAARPTLLMALTWREIIVKRQTQILTNLRGRGFNLDSKLTRLRVTPLWIRPLAASIIQGAGYRVEYCRMLDVRVIEFPRSSIPRLFSAWQKLIIGMAILSIGYHLLESALR